ncbi:uncharacterized protein LOC120835847 [Gasterosteus aculeatus]|uniref:uncharacterized protein LOC120835847 n=1 Tax=Gasterosteus aculeatus aculeatus TaxID=481459 RepID=UPI001A980DD0|nr:uncharacterized protein LOC120835847 [Gasterosteus aculeatus aculeatus]
MGPQLYLTMYKEQFVPPGTANREQPRPTSAHRRNNPQPRPDFLFPRNLQRNLRSRRTHPHPSPPVDGGQGPLFPPVRHVSFHSPLPTCPDHSPLTAVDQPNHMPPARPSTVLPLPPAGGLHNLQLAEAPSDTGFKLQATLRSPTRGMSYQRNVHPLSAQQQRQHGGAQLRTRPQTINLQHHFPRTQYRSGGYSCFHVVKPSEAGHYIIHPEFVSECRP